MEKVHRHRGRARMESGRWTPVSRFDDAIAERQREFPEHTELIGRWKTGWPAMLGDAIPETRVGCSTHCAAAGCASMR